jgi:hypothetical protein
VLAAETRAVKAITVYFNLWDKRIRTFVYSYQKRGPYHLAIPHKFKGFHKKLLFQQSYLNFIQQKTCLFLPYLITFLLEDIASNTK